MVAEVTTLQFRRTPAEFVANWQATKTLERIGTIFSYIAMALSGVFLVLHIFYALMHSGLPFFSLFDGSLASRAVWLSILVDLPAVYLLQEIKRRDTYTSKDDVFAFLDPISRSILAQIFGAAGKQGTLVTPSVLLRLLLSSGYMQSILGRLEINSQALVDGMPQDLLPSPPEARGIAVDETVSHYIITSGERALARGDQSFGVTDIFLTVLENEDPVLRYFETVGLTLDRMKLVLGWVSAKDHMRQEYSSLRNKRMHTGPKNQAWTSKPTPHLDRYSQDVTLAAAYGNVPLVTVRTKEIEESIRVLGRAGKNNILLVGEPGVGKNAIVERIALKMIGEDVPLPLQDKRLVKLDTSALHADPQGFAACFEQIVTEAEQAGNVILYIPELQDLSEESTSGLAAVKLLLPIMERGRMQVIGATTLKEYHEQIEQSSSVADSFGVIIVPEMSPEDAVHVLEETALELEARHHVTISLKSIETAVSLSARYIHDRVLPEKAIEVLDEAAVLVSRSKRHEVTESDVRQILSDETRVPLTQMEQGEQSLLLNLEQSLHSRVIGQDEAVSAVAEALRRARVGLQDSNRPIGVFLFVGPTGVGKTELAKALADVYFQNKDALVRLDMSEFRENDAIDKLLGTAGADGLLTGPVRTHPFVLLLLDEFEKAGDQVRNLFLQIFDDGRATDGTGHVVDFKNSIIIATSNAGSLEIQQALQSNVDYATIQKQLVTTILPQQFRPELLNRFDGVIVFKTLTQDQIKQIAGLQLADVVSRLKQSTGVEVTFTDAVVAQLASLGFDPEYGGRPLRRVIQDKVEGALAKKVLEKQVKQGDHITFDVGDLA